MTSSQTTASSFPSLPGFGGAGSGSDDSQRSLTLNSQQQPPLSASKSLDATCLFDGDITSTQTTTAPVTAEKPTKRRKKDVAAASTSAASASAGSEVASPSLLGGLDKTPKAVLMLQEEQLTEAVSPPVTAKVHQRGKRPKTASSEAEPHATQEETALATVSSSLTKKKRVAKKPSVVEQEEEDELGGVSTTTAAAVEVDRIPETELAEQPPPPPPTKKTSGRKSRASAAAVEEEDAAAVIPETELVEPPPQPTKKTSERKTRASAAAAAAAAVEEETAAAAAVISETELVEPPPPPPSPKKTSGRRAQEPTTPLAPPAAAAAAPLTTGTQTQSPPSPQFIIPETLPATLPPPPPPPPPPALLHFDFDDDAPTTGDLFRDPTAFMPLELDSPQQQQAASPPPPPPPAAVVTLVAFDGDADHAFFDNVLASAGVSNVHSTHLALLVPRSKFAASLRANLRGEDRIRVFLLNLQAYIAHSASNFKKCLLPLRAAADDDQAAVDASSSLAISRDPSLLHTLLKIDALQPELIKRLLELFLEYALNDDDDELPKRILQSLCWLDFVCKPKELTDVLLETLQSLHGMNNRWLADAVQSLPEILPDQFHGDAVVALTQMLKESTSQSSAAIISCLADLSIPTLQLKMELIDTVLGVLQSKPLEDLPVIVSFLLSSCASLQEKDKQMYILKEMRHSLQFLSAAPRGETERSNEALVVKGMIHSFLAHPALAACFIEQCKSKTTPPPPLLTVDVWLLFALSRTMPQAVRECIKLKFPQHDAFRRAILGHAAALEICGMDNALELASYFLRIGIQTKDAELLRRFAGSVLAWLFEASGEDLRSRQEIVHCIVSHCCPGQRQEQEEEVNSALQCLDTIVTTTTTSNNKPETLAPFSAYLRSLMNELDCFNAQQARILLRVVSRLTLIDGEGMDELKIFLRKYLMSSEHDRQVLGVVGTVQLASSLAPGEEEAGDDNQDRVRQRVDVREAMALLDGMLRETRHPFTFDELARAIECGELHREVVHSLHETLEQAFEEWYLFDLRAPVVFSGAGADGLGDPQDLWALEDDSSSGVSLKILPLLARAQKDAHVKSRLQLLCPMLRCMLATCHGMAAPENLITCPLVLPHADNLLQLDKRFSLVKDIVCTSLVAACNWMREVVSSFSQMDGSTLGREAWELLARRLGTLVVAEQHLVVALTQAPQFCDAAVASAAEAAGGGGGGQGRPRKPTAAASSKAKRVKKSPAEEGQAGEEEEEEDGGGGGEDEAEEVAPGKEEKGGKPPKAGGGGKSSSPEALAQAALACSVREFSPHALRVLAIPGLRLVFGDPLLGGKLQETEEDDEGEEEDELGKAPRPVAAAAAAAASAAGTPALHVAALRLLLQSCTRHLGQHMVEKVVFGRRVKKRSLGPSGGGAPSVPLPVLLLILHDKALPSVCSFFQQICARALITPGLPPPALGLPAASVKDAVQCLELTLGVISSTCRLYHPQRLISKDELVQQLAHFTLETTTTTTSTSSDVALPFVLRGVYQFLVQTSQDSALFSASLASQIVLCGVLKELVLLHNEVLPASLSGVAGHDGDCARESGAFKDKLSKLCLEVLKQDWTSSSSSAGLPPVKPSKQNVGVLLDLYHEYAADGLRAVELTAGELAKCLHGASELELAFPTLTSKTVPVYYSSAMSSMASLSGNVDLADSALAGLCVAFADSVMLTKLDKISTQVLRDAMRGGRVFLDQFVKKHMPRLSSQLKSRQAHVMDDVLGVLQKATRQLQNLCTHAKSKKDASILQATPALRRALESFLCSIKSMLSENDLLEKAGFFVGVLKARNLNGSLVKGGGGGAGAAAAEEDS